MNGPGTAHGALLGRRGFADAVGEALAGGYGFAAGKLGGTERAWLTYPLLREGGATRLQLRAFEAALAHRSVRHAGVWPADADFQSRFSDEFATAVAELDAVGIFPEAHEASLELLGDHGMDVRAMRFEDQEPDRRPGAPAADCWLEHLRGRRVLIVGAFAEVLRERARRDVYEAVWAGARKRWFEPAAVVSLEIPYGFEPATQARYADALELLEETAARIEGADFDLAMIGAGGLGIPLAARIKRGGRAAISLGGHLQVVFGVHGRRWLDRAEWRERWINDAWISVPDRYRPEPGLSAEDYW
jgi:hypothetical protein